MVVNEVTDNDGHDHDSHDELQGDICWAGPYSKLSNYQTLDTFTDTTETFTALQKPLFMMVDWCLATRGMSQSDASPWLASRCPYSPAPKSNERASLNKASNGVHVPYSYVTLYFSSNFRTPYLADDRARFFTSSRSLTCVFIKCFNSSRSWKQTTEWLMEQLLATTKNGAMRYLRVWSMVLIQSHLCSSAWLDLIMTVISVTIQLTTSGSSLNKELWHL